MKVGRLVHLNDETFTPAGVNAPRARRLGSLVKTTLCVILPEQADPGGRPGGMGEVQSTARAMQLSSCYLSRRKERQLERGSSTPRIASAARRARHGNATFRPWSRRAARFRASNGARPLTSLSK